MFKDMPEGLSDFLHDHLIEGEATVTSATDNDAEIYFIIDYENLEDYLTIVQWDRQGEDWLLMNLSGDLLFKVRDKLNAMID